ncbi:gp53-like domain-containing protein [Phascolarctobacterium succinatutens]|uniref:gp53-like domain-containing protein n=1 Tax=Phascolarctobacterium succinatutens TaxID=626940 RepID=UPI003FD81CAC
MLNCELCVFSLSCFWQNKILIYSFIVHSFFLSTLTRAIFYLQWGKSLTAESKASVTFPISFERIVYFVDVFSLDAGRPCLFTKSHPITTNGFYWEYNYHGDDVGVQWLAIGV